MRLPTPVLLTLLALAVAVLLGLGTWQVQRNEWKRGVVAERDARLAAAPLEPTAVLSMEAPELAWRRVHLMGTWDHPRSMVLANRIRFGVKGEELVTPLIPGDGGAAILVNRGWYPEGERDRVRAALDAERTADVVGLAVDATGRTAKRTPQGTWTGLAPTSMGQWSDASFRTWAVIQGTVVEDEARPPADGALPVRQYHRFVNTTPHVQYAVTWYGIAAALVAIAVARLVIAPRRARREAMAAEEASEGSPPTS